MTHVRLKDIPFDERYVNLVLEGNISIDSLVGNLECLYSFIDKNAPHVSIWQYGNAYRVILKKARALAGQRRSHIISKKQVVALIRPEIRNDTAESIRIPYTADYIFRAIFAIFDEYKNNPAISIPPEIIALYGNVRREVFYERQSDRYRNAINNNLLNRRDELEVIRRNLANDLCSDDCALGRRF